VRTNKPEHVKTFDYLGLHQYFLTFCTHQRRTLFSTPERVTLVRTQIERAALQERVALIAYCFMPDHVHLLVEGQSDDSDCLAFISRAKQFSGFYYQARFEERLWQRYGYEHTLRSDEAVLGVVRYIVENPVRAGLTESARDYPYSGSSVYSIDEILDAVQMQRGWWRRSG
jgi:REP element-mobilizing transposase RayT